MAQELLTTFENGFGEVALIPGGGGIFEVRLDGEMIFSRKQEGRFPKSKELKQKVRGSVAKNILTTFYSGNKSPLTTIFCVASEFFQQSRL